VSAQSGVTERVGLGVRRWQVSSELLVVVERGREGVAVKVARKLTERVEQVYSWWGVEYDWLVVHEVRDACLRSVPLGEGDCERLRACLEELDGLLRALLPKPQSGSSRIFNMRYAGT
jgi:hypothetical protein